MAMAKKKIASLQTRIENLEHKTIPQLAVIRVEYGETQEDAEARHYKLHPHDREAKLAIFVERGGTRQIEKGNSILIPIPGFDAVIEITK